MVRSSWRDAKDLSPVHEDPGMILNLKLADPQG
jgi:hypothetical protein